jgi:hypothetical protein
MTTEAGESEAIGSVVRAAQLLTNLLVSIEHRYNAWIIYVGSCAFLAVRCTTLFWMRPTRLLVEFLPVVVFEDVWDYFGLSEVLWKSLITFCGTVKRGTNHLAVRFLSIITGSSDYRYRNGPGR